MSRQHRHQLHTNTPHALSVTTLDFTPHSISHSPPPSTVDITLYSTWLHTQLWRGCEMSNNIQTTVKNRFISSWQTLKFLFSYNNSPNSFLFSISFDAKLYKFDQSSIIFVFAFIASSFILPTLPKWASDSGKFDKFPACHAFENKMFIASWNQTKFVARVWLSVAMAKVHNGTRGKWLNGNNCAMSLWALTPPNQLE